MSDAKPNSHLPDSEESPVEIRTVIAGMHRSGTSLAARVVQLLGVSLGNEDELLGPGADNRAGYFEHRAVKGFNDELLGVLGGSWDRPPLLKSDWQFDSSLESWLADAKRIVQESFGSDSGISGPIGIKDPRMSLLMPFWHRVAAIATTIVLVRDPREVAASLAARRFQVDIDTAAGLWLRYLLAVSTDHVPQLVIRHDSLFDDLDSTIDHLVAHLGLPGPDSGCRARIAEQVNPQLRHQMAGTTTPDSPLLSFALDVWNDGGLDIDSISDDIRGALAEGRVQPAASQQDARHARAAAQSYKVQLKRRNDLIRVLEQRIGMLASLATVSEQKRSTSAPGLLVPVDLFVSDTSRERLAETLAAIADDYDGVTGPRISIPPGSSVVTVAERQRIANPPLMPFIGHDVDGIVMLRDGSLGESTSLQVRLADGLTCFEDAGAPCSDPWVAVEPEPATADGCPPFPQRVVVVFLGSTPDDDVDDLCRDWVNHLVRGGVEARLVVPDPPPGMHLAAPCSPCQESLSALQPDVVVALDGEALANAVAWCDPPPVFAQFSHDTVHGLRLGAWETAGTTVRMKVGRTSSVRDIANAVIRLSSGPFVLGTSRDSEPSRIFAPPEISDSESEEADQPDDEVAQHSVAIVHEPLSPSAARMTAISEMLSASDFLVDGGLTAVRTAGRASTDFAIINAGRPSRLLDRIVAARVQAGKQSAVWLDALDILYDRDAPDGVGDFTATARERLEHSGRAITPSSTISRAVHRLGYSAHTLPDIVPGRLFERLRALEALSSAEAPTVGWILDCGAAAPPSSTDAVAASITRLLEAHATMKVEIHAPSKWDARELRDHPRVTRSVSPPRTTSLSHWTTQIWTPSSRQVRLFGRTRAAIEAGVVGVPTVLTAGSAELLGGLADPRLIVAQHTDEDSWSDAISLSLDPIEHASRARRARSVADVLFGETGRIIAGHRLATWLTAGCGAS